MNEPPNSWYFACGRSGQPIVCTTRRNGFATFQTSFTPSAQTCGLSPSSPNVSIATPVRWPCVPSQRIVTRARMSEPGSKFGEPLAEAAASLVAGSDSDDASVLDEQLLRDRLRKDRRARLLGLLREPAGQLRQGRDVVPVVLHRRRRRDPHRAVVPQEVDALRLDLAVERHVRGPLLTAEQAPEAARVDDRAGERVRARLLALLEHGHRDLAQPLREPGDSSISWPSRIAQASPAGPAPTIRIPTSIRSSGGSVGSSTNSRASNCGGYSAGRGRAISSCAASRARSAWGRSRARRRRRRGRRTRRSARSGPC